ncbi:MAG: hypothetical protein AVDCRST_MAG59-4851, partial [uncultured Thermomicrobiales bacterium]
GPPGRPPPLAPCSRKGLPSPLVPLPCQGEKNDDRRRCPTTPVIL